MRPATTSYLRRSTIAARNYGVYRAAWRIRCRGGQTVTTWRVLARGRRFRRELLVAAACALVLVSLFAASSPAHDQGSSPAGHAAHVTSAAVSHSAPGALDVSRAASPPEATLQLQALIGQHS